MVEQNQGVFIQLKAPFRESTAAPFFYSAVFAIACSRWIFGEHLGRDLGGVRDLEVVSHAPIFYVFACSVQASLFDRFLEVWRSVWETF